MKTVQLFAVLLGMAVIAMLVAGCSTDSPVTPGNSASQALTQPALTESGSGIQFAARVIVADENQRMLLFAGHPEEIIALQNCQITRLQNENETPIPFSDIHPGDTAYMYGVRTQDGYIYAHRLRVCEGGCEGLCYDVAFRDTISEIDYAAGTFRVLNRTELITTDDNTIIRGIVSQWCPDPSKTQTKEQTRSGEAACEGTQLKLMGHDTLLTITDLQVGDVVEVRAYVVDETTLLAAKVTLAPCDGEPNSVKKCVEFSDYIATIDYDTRVLTFDGNDWVGMVCDGASLKDMDGVQVDLTAFNAGDYVAVKGFPLEDGTLRICQLALSNP